MLDAFHFDHETLLREEEEERVKSSAGEQNHTPVTCDVTHFFFIFNVKAHIRANAQNV